MRWARARACRAVAVLVAVIALTVLVWRRDAERPGVPGSRRAAA
ncbi:hypothetical protein [Streptomyces noursei]|nr:hypothetical protein [Streptomyces noursei]MCZ1013697.1 hypothetical protein [Streptomyces noursei]